MSSWAKEGKLGPGVQELRESRSPNGTKGVQGSNGEPGSKDLGSQKELKKAFKIGWTVQKMSANNNYTLNTMS